MSESPPIAERDPGAPIARDAIDPELIKLKRARTKVGIITAAGVVTLCVYFLIRLGPDRRFGGAGDEPAQVAVSDVVAGKVDEDRFISIEADPMMSQAVRAVKTRGDFGHRVAPVRGTEERLWLVVSGDGWDKPAGRRYVGRLRKLSALPFFDAIDGYAAAHPRPVFARPAEVRTGFSAGKVRTVTGDVVTVRDADQVAFDVVDPERAIVVATFTPKTEEHGPLLDAAAWTAELARVGIPATPSSAPAQTDGVLGQARFDVAMSVAAVTSKLEGAKLWAARVEPVTRHHDTTWGELKRAPVPDAQLDLVGLYVGRGVPGDAYALITGEIPQDYWYVMPITVALALIGLLFAWALVRAVRRDLLPTRA